MIIKKSKLVVILFSTGFFFNSCIKSSIESDEKRVAIEFTVKNLNEDIQIEEDTIHIDEFKFSIDRFKLYATEEVILQTNSDVTALIFGYDENISGARLILDVGLGFSDVDIFQGYEIFLEPLRNRSNIFDADFFGEPENFSMIIKGQVNGVDFEFKSRQSFTKLFDISSVQLDGINETLSISKSIDLNTIFVNESGLFLNPERQENEDGIILNIQNNLTVVASASSLF